MISKNSRLEEEYSAISTLMNNFGIDDVMQVENINKNDFEIENSSLSTVEENSILGGFQSLGQNMNKADMLETEGLIFGIIRTNNMRNNFFDNLCLIIGRTLMKLNQGANIIFPTSAQFFMDSQAVKLCNGCLTNLENNMMNNVEMCNYCQKPLCDSCLILCGSCQLSFCHFCVQIR